MGTVKMKSKVGLYLRVSTSNGQTTENQYCNEQINKGVQSMRTSRITDDMFARIPALLLEGMTKAEIAAMYGVTLGTLVVLCSQRGISLRKGGPLPKRTNLTLPDEPLPLSDGVLKSLREAARAMGKKARHGWSAISWRRSPATVSTRQCWTRRLHDDLASARLGAW